MEKKFSVFEILEVAERIELNAARFYLKASELYDDSQLRDIYHKLANWRAKHEKILTQRRRSRRSNRRNLLKRNGTPGAIRTRGLWLRRPTLYPAELRAHMSDGRSLTEFGMNGRSVCSCESLEFRCGFLQNRYSRTTEYFAHSCSPA